MSLRTIAHGSMAEHGIVVPDADQDWFLHEVAA